MANYNHGPDRKGLDDSDHSATQTEKPGRNNVQQVEPVEELRAHANARLANPLAGFSHDELALKAEAYVRDNRIGDDEDIRAFRLGAILAQNQNRWRELEGLSIEESEVLEREITSVNRISVILYRAQEGGREETSDSPEAPEVSQTESLNILTSYPSGFPQLPPRNARLTSIFTIGISGLNQNSCTW